MRKQIYEQELQKEQEAKQRVKDDLMEALVRRIPFKNIDILFFILFSFIQIVMLIKYLKIVLKILKKNVKKKYNQLCLIW